MRNAPVSRCAPCRCCYSAIPKPARRFWSQRRSLADILGIFGREALDYGTLWGPPKPTDPGAFAFKIFLNYDGAGNQFGETSVSGSSSDPDTLSLYAAQSSDSALTVLVLNKSTSDGTDNRGL